MTNSNNKIKNIIKIFLIIGFISQIIYAKNKCSRQLFTVTLNSSVSIRSVLENLANSCNLSILPEDKETRNKLKQKVYYVKLVNASLYEFLDTILKDNNIFYSLIESKLKISFLQTKIFNLDYIAANRESTSNAKVDISDSGENSTNNASGMTIKSEGKFAFWDKIGQDVNQILKINSHSKSFNKALINKEAGIISIRGTVKQINKVSEYLKRIDSQLSSQVLIDVKILTVEFTNSNTTGIDWSKLYNLQSSTLALTGSLGTKQENLNADGTTKNIKNGATLTFNSSVNTNDVIKFLKTQGDVKSMSNPKLLTLNNQPALISVGKQIFYKIKSTSTIQGTSGAGTSSQGEDIKSVFAGILLDITPEISKDGYITLRINPSISDTDGSIDTKAGISRESPPDLIRKQISAVVKLKDKEHVVLGGLISSSNSFQTNKVPLLGDLPLLEYLFKYEQKIERVNELVIIITPHIIKRNKNISLESLGYRKLRYGK